MLKWQSIGFHFSALKFSYTFHSPGTNALHFVIVTRNEFSQFTNNIADLKKIYMMIKCLYTELEYGSDIGQELLL